MDVQGAEREVLAHGRAKLKDTVVIQTEVSFVPLYQDQPVIRRDGPGAAGAGLSAPLRHRHQDLAACRPWWWAMQPNRGIRQLLETDMVYVRDFTRPENMSAEQWKHLALVAHHCYGSYDLALKAIVTLMRTGRRARRRQPALSCQPASQKTQLMLKNISIRGAREHNLKNIDVEIPRDTLTVLTGLSGSGKSCLAFDTIYAEGQRRYVESLSAYARQFLELMQKPDVDHIEGLSPAISIEQKTTSKNPRSTVGTVTEIYDYLRLLFARVGVPYSPATGLPIESQTVSQMADRILALPEGTRLYLLAPIVRGRKGEYRKELAELQKKGFQRAKVDGKFYDIGATPALDKKLKHDIEIVVDRIVVKPDIGNRLPDSIETALNLADGLLVVEFADEKEKDGKPKQIMLVVQIRLPGLRLHHFGDRAAAVLLQQSRMAPARNATGWGCRIISTKRWWCRTKACP